MGALLCGDGTCSQALSRLLDEVPWKGSNVKRYRNGGRGMENPLTAEVLQGLSNLSRDLSLGEVLRCAHGADQTRCASAEEVEHAYVDVLPPICGFLPCLSACTRRMCLQAHSGHRGPLPEGGRT